MICSCANTFSQQRAQFKGRGHYGCSASCLQRQGETEMKCLISWQLVVPMIHLLSGSLLSAAVDYRAAAGLGFKCAPSKVGGCAAFGEEQVPKVGRQPEPWRCVGVFLRSQPMALAEPQRELHAMCIPIHFSHIWPVLLFGSDVRGGRRRGHRKTRGARNESRPSDCKDCNTAAMRSMNIISHGRI